MMNAILNWLVERAIAIRNLAKQVSENRGDKLK